MPIDPQDFYFSLQKNGIQFFTGVPDSLLKQLCLCIDDNVNEENHVITANEGNAIGLAAGYHLGSGDIPLVYMQNSGTGNMVNPILSLCDPDVYSIPMIVLVGWRGEPGVVDEPQHIKQGRVQLAFLESLEIPYEIIHGEEMNYFRIISNSIEIAKNENRPFCILIKKGTFDIYHSKSTKKKGTFFREVILNTIIGKLPKKAIVVSTTGKTSRELFEIREQKKQGHEKDFLTVGSMGHCSSIALGIAISNPERQVICIDGDGSLLMHMGSLSTIGKLHPSNYYHILINNKVYESVGGQKTAADVVDFQLVAKANNYSEGIVIEDEKKLNEVVGSIFNRPGPVLIEILVDPGSRDDLGRPTVKPIDNKIAFMQYLKK